MNVFVCVCVCVYVCVRACVRECVGVGVGVGVGVCVRVRVRVRVYKAYAQQSDPFSVVCVYRKSLHQGPEGGDVSPQVPTDSLPTGPGPPGLLPGLPVNTSGQYMVFTGCQISHFILMLTVK